MFDSSVRAGRADPLPAERRDQRLDRRRAADGGRRQGALLDPGRAGLRRQAVAPGHARRARWCSTSSCCRSNSAARSVARADVGSEDQRNVGAVRFGRRNNAAIDPTTAAVPRYRLQYEGAFLADLRSLRRAYDLPLITGAALQLADQAEVPSRHRRTRRPSLGAQARPGNSASRLTAHPVPRRRTRRFAASGTIQRFEIN